MFSFLFFNFLFNVSSDGRFPYTLTISHTLFTLPCNNLNWTMEQKKRYLPYTEPNWIQTTQSIHHTMTRRIVKEEPWKSCHNSRRQKRTHLWILFHRKCTLYNIYHIHKCIIKKIKISLILILWFRLHTVKKCIE